MGLDVFIYCCCSYDNEMFLNIAAIYCYIYKMPFYLDGYRANLIYLSISSNITKRRKINKIIDFAILFNQPFYKIFFF